MTDYGQMIKRAREEAGITQEALGKAIGVSGVTIMRYEKGQRNPSSKVIGEIAEVLGEPFLKLFLDASDDFAVKTREKLEATREGDETRSREITAAAEAKFTSQVDSFVVSPIGRSIISAFYELNKYGQEEAMERIIELTFLPQFSSNEVPSEWEEYVEGYLSNRYATKYQRQLSSDESSPESSDK